MENIIVLMAGTVDPICHNSTKKYGSYSYNHSEGNYYWEDSHELIKLLENLADKDEHIHFFNEHGWSGKNIKENRETAGRYLANRLCGGNNVENGAYYPKFLNKNVAFHLIGHSHGGNLINEFTEQAATTKEWSEQWKIKSITYLSTPFFNKKHRVNTKVLAPDCKIINVFNQFDLTQNILASFSMYDLFSAIEVVGKNNKNLEKTINKIKQNPLQNEIEEI
ncbi:MAG: hypothetical protein WBA39_08775, partial [Rivularia sp. (in: cyanobacteria)]